MIYEMYYDEINAELQRMSAINDAEVPEQKIYIGSSEDMCPVWMQEAINNKGVICVG